MHRQDGGSFRGRRLRCFRTLGLWCAFTGWLLGGLGVPRAAEAPPEGAAGQTLQMVLALDTSGSMKANDPLGLMPKAAWVLANLLSESDFLSLMGFDDAPRGLVPPGTLNEPRRRQCRKALLGLKPRGKYTDILAAMAEGLQAFDLQRAGPRVLVLLTDGHMDIDPRKGNSKASVARVQQEMVPACSRAGVAVYTVAFTRQSDQELLKSLAEGTGGRHVLVETAETLHLAFARFFEDLKRPQTAPINGDRFLIDPHVQAAKLLATRAAKGRPVVLEDPKGRQIAAGKGIDKESWFGSPAFDMVSLNRPLPGVWRLKEHQTGAGKVVLTTDLELICHQVPDMVGADEVLTVGAGLARGGEPVSDPEMLKGVRFTAELTTNGQPPLAIELKAPLSGEEADWPPGTRRGSFPTFSRPGAMRLTVRAEGRDFQRERNFSVAVSLPWYQGEVTTGSGRDPVAVRFDPGAGARLNGLRGWAGVRSGQGKMAARFFQPPADGAFTLSLAPAGSGPCRVDLSLTGRHPAGRPLAIRPAALAVDVPPAPAPTPPPAPPVTGVNKQPQPKGPLAKARAWLKGSKSWRLVGLGLSVVLLAGGLVFLYRFFWIGGEAAEAGGKSQGSFGKLRLKAQVEVLTREKGELEAALKDAEERLKQADKEKEELSRSLERQSHGFQEKAKLMEEMESKIKQMEGEAKAVQEEYLALYARGQEEKKGLAKE